MRKMTVVVHGHTHDWSFSFDGDPAFLAEWREDGLDVTETLYTIPEELPVEDIRTWCFEQDLQKMETG